jgi:hypothetical protein
MRFKDIFPGVAFATIAPVARAVGFSPKSIRNKFYQGDNPLGITKVDGRLVVPAENFDAWLDRAYLQGGLEHLCNADTTPPAAADADQPPKRGRGRPRKIVKKGGVE